MVIGVIGGSGSGKSVVSRVAKDFGFNIIDADKVGHDVILKGNRAYNEIVKAFGDDILNSDGEINRRKLGELVFSDENKLELLNSITHPKITEEIKSRIGEKTVIDGAVLHKTPIIGLCDRVVFVHADKEKRLTQILSRDHITYEAALNRINSQPDDEEYRKFSDYVIENNGTEEELLKKAWDFFHGEII